MAMTQQIENLNKETDIIKEEPNGNWVEIYIAEI